MFFEILIPLVELINTEVPFLHIFEDIEWIPLADLEHAELYISLFKILILYSIFSRKDQTDVEHLLAHVFFTSLCMFLIYLE